MAKTNGAALIYKKSVEEIEKELNETSARLFAYIKDELGIDHSYDCHNLAITTFVDSKDSNVIVGYKIVPNSNKKVSVFVGNNEASVSINKEEVDFEPEEFNNLAVNIMLALDSTDFPNKIKA